MPSEQLKFCPFCGATDAFPELRSEPAVMRFSARIVCGGCGANGPTVDADSHDVDAPEKLNAGAAKQWNNRSGGEGER